MVFKIWFKLPLLVYHEMVMIEEMLLNAAKSRMARAKKSGYQ